MVKQILNIEKLIDAFTKNKTSFDEACLLLSNGNKPLFDTVCSWIKFANNEKNRKRIATMIKSHMKIVEVCLKYN